MSYYVDALAGRAQVWSYFSQEGLSARQERLQRELRRIFLLGDTYYVSPEIGAVVEETAALIPEDAAFASIDDLVAPSGFVWLGKALPLSEKTVSIRGNKCAVQAFYWFSRIDSASGIAELAVYVFETETSHRFPGVTSIQVWPWGVPLNGVRFFPTMEPMDAGDPERIMAYVYCLNEFMRTSIFTAEREPAPRAWRRRTDQAERGVMVVRLRRQKRSAVEHRDVQWSHQWIVRAHWRRQWMRSSQQHRITLVRPHVKGPPDKPLMAPRERIFAVVR